MKQRRVLTIPMIDDRKHQLHRRTNGLAVTLGHLYFLLGVTTAAFGRWGLSSPRRTISRRVAQLGLSELPFEDDVIRSSDKMNAFVDAAAASTQQYCALLGVKCVGVDYGLVRTGLARAVGFEPQPITILSDSNATEVAKEVVKYCALEHAKRIIVGLPLHKNGTEAPQSVLTRAFASQISCLALARLGPNVPVYLWDERYTSKEAAARARSRDPSQNLYKVLDADSACIILENYYELNGEGAELVEVPGDMKDLCVRAWEAQEEVEAMRKQMEQDQRNVSRTQRRHEAMDRARKLEEELAKDGRLGTNRKKKKKKRR